MRLSTRVHDRDAAGMTYVYPVVSRRAGGVSIGINLNPNNACNWRCVYCQVPGLVLGRAPEIDLELLRSELTAMFEAIVNGDYLERHVPEDSRRLNDVAFSGNGEPTSSAQFEAAVATACETLERFGLAGDVKLVLITNGSLIHKPEVRAGLTRMARANGQVWFKLDSATEEGQARINNNPPAGTGPVEDARRIERTRRNLRLCAELCPTWIQTMAFARDGASPSEEEQRAYVDFLDDTQRAGTVLQGVLLYGLARRSHQPEASALSPLRRDWLEAFAERIRGIGLEVRLSL